MKSRYVFLDYGASKSYFEASSEIGRKSSALKKCEQCYLNLSGSAIPTIVSTTFQRDVIFTSYLNFPDWTTRCRYRKCHHQQCTRILEIKFLFFVRITTSSWQMNGLRLCLLHLLLERQVSSDFVCLKFRKTYFTVPCFVYFFFRSKSFFKYIFNLWEKEYSMKMFVVCSSVSDSVSHPVINISTRCFVHIVMNFTYKSVFWVSTLVREKFRSLKMGIKQLPLLAVLGGGVPYIPTGLTPRDFIQFGMNLVYRSIFTMAKNAPKRLSKLSNVPQLLRSFFCGPYFVRGLVATFLLSYLCEIWITTNVQQKII